jgi:UDP-glucuronate decarboxylase
VRIVPQIILNKDLKIKGDGNQTRNFIYIDDVVEIAILAMEADKNGTYNVDAGEEHSINQVIGLVKEITGLEISPDYRGGEDISAKALDIEKTKKDFNWEPKVSLRQGLIKTTKYYNDKIKKQDI